MRAIYSIGSENHKINELIILLDLGKCGRWANYLIGSYNLKFTFN